MRVMNKTAQLRSQSVLASVKAQGERYGSPMSKVSFSRKSLNNSVMGSNRSQTRIGKLMQPNYDLKDSYATLTAKMPDRKASLGIDTTKKIDQSIFTTKIPTKSIK